MVRTCKRPQCFEKLEDDFMYFEGYDTEPYVYAAISFHPPNAYMHLEVIRWSHNILKNLIVDWSILKKIIKENGVNIITITKPGTLAENEAFVKFLNRLGLSQPHEILIAAYEI
jgi:hypothetical protein